MIEKKHNTKNRSSIYLHIILLLMFSTFLVWLFYQPVKKFITKDTATPVMPIGPAEKEKFGNPPVVTVGLYIRNWPEFSISENKFIADLTVWFRFDPKRISVEKLRRFHFDRANTIYKSKPYVMSIKDTVFARFYVRIEFTTNLNYESFPLDDHKINISLIYNSLSPSDAIFTSNNDYLTMDPEIKIQGWDLADKMVKTGYIEETLDPHEKKSQIYHPRVVFSLYFARSGIRHVISIIIPLILIFLIAVFTLTIVQRYKDNTALGIAVASISAIIAHRFVISAMSPKPGYLMISDLLFIWLLIGCCILFMINIFGREIPKGYKNIIIILSYIYLVAGLLYFILPALK